MPDTSVHAVEGADYERRTSIEISTLGRRLNEMDDRMVRSDGRHPGLAESRPAALSHPHRAASAGRKANRWLLLVQHNPGDVIDSYWPMEHNTTVFGFARLDLKTFLAAAPAHFTVGLIDTVEFHTTRTGVMTSCQDLQTRGY